MRYFLLITALACTPDGPENLRESGEVESLLALDFDVIAERARPLPNTRARLTAHGPPLEGELWSSAGWQTYAVVDAADRIGVLWQGRDLQLILWIDRVDLPITPVEASWMGGLEVGLRLPAGTEVEPLETAGRQVRVRAVGQDVQLDAWVNRYLLDNWWYDESPAALDTSDAVDPVHIEAGADLLDAPDGTSLGRVQEGTSLLGWVAEAHGMYRRVRFSSDDWEGNVWVHEDDLDARNLFGGRGWAAGASAACGGVLWGSPPNVREGALLLTEPGGEVVGKTTRDTRLSLSGDPDGWQETRLDTAFGEASLWISPDDLLD